MAISDEQVKKDIVNQLYWDQMVDASDITVDVSDGKVTLAGSVPSFAARGAAYNDAVIIPGVNLVDSKLEVKLPPALQPVTDDEIKTMVEKVLHWNADIDATNITASVIGGRVTLNGYLDAYWKKTKASELVSDIFGVLEVDNAISVVPVEGSEDRVIADDIMMALRRSTDIDTNTIEVMVADGVVTISGTVPNWTAFKAAEHIADNTAGVVGVTNDLFIETF